MSQSRSLSALEAAANVVVDWMLALATQLAVFPAIGLQVTPAQHLWASLAFTSVSFLRGYAPRRLFVRFG
ncbi:hypothetical protein FHY55_12880 [Oceanicola sp. D3]|uniref:DUF7220 family protein n=1 Tax=Oceanicola sp. D3 TaxID=2587163 RepID=UPI00111EEB0F|nr:hypothetical protein [Oceanicola sp. D3]QDC10086.1 hypothetical protein FHY55_12880 [Oceanicola sp. D3]